ncbi:DUF4430 domain-containing protein [Bacteroidota bacterium]
MTGCQNQSSEGEATIIVEILGQNRTSHFHFHDATLLEILGYKYEVKTRKTLYTDYLSCLEGVCANDEYSWVYYVNGEPLNMGVDVYKVQDGDVILFSYRKV